jgi:glycosyltransferase involved in cell wall biosynthesis
MRIAQVAPLYESVPPKLYGGTERVVAYLTEELVAQGHEVTLFASGDSQTTARLVPCCPKSLRLDSGCVDQLAHHYVMLDEVLTHADEFDIIHFHLEYLHFPLTRVANLRTVTTVHGRLDLPDLVPLYRKYDDMPLISISHAQRKPLGFANWIGNVYHGLPKDSLTFGQGSRKYLAFLGRIAHEKRVDRAIQIAREVGMPLKISAKVDPSDRKYYENYIKPLLADPNVEFIGEINDSQKAEFLGNAYALLFPIDWPEPFGLVMIEAMACGTPTVAFNCGSVPEVLRHGTTGFILKKMTEAADAVRQVSTLSRAACRAEFEARFTAARMAQEYVKLYKAVLAAGPHSEESPMDAFLTV